MRLRRLQVAQRDQEIAGSAADADAAIEAAAKELGAAPKRLNREASVQVATPRDGPGKRCVHLACAAGDDTHSTHTLRKG